MIAVQPLDRDLYVFPPDRCVRPEDIADGMRVVLAGTGEDVTREGLLDTPNRHARFWREFLFPAPIKFTTFAAEGMDEMVVQTGIPFFSVCEHHLLPFFGTAAVAYVPDARLVGLSKLARLVDLFARAPQNQERITTQVADVLETRLAPKGVAVHLKARHLCMEMRGVKAHDTFTTTVAVRGRFRDDPKTRAEFMALVTGG
jgi:GTP cyclohydrolase I